MSIFSDHVIYVGPKYGVTSFLAVKGNFKGEKGAQCPLSESFSSQSEKSSWPRGTSSNTHKAEEMDDAV